MHLSGKLLILLLALAAVQLGAQDLTHYKRVVKELCSAKYQGRGYARGGANKAGKYLEKEYRKAGADEVLLQPFSIDINTFPGKMSLWADGKRLTPGVDFAMREYSPGVRGEFPVYHVDTLNFDAGMRGFTLFERINGEKQYFQTLNRGELAANSDHYPFATRGVPCIFLENEDGDAFPFYHTIYDSWENAVFDSYEPVFKLVTEFISRY